MPRHPDQRRYLDAQRIYRDAADPLGSADLVVDNTDPAQPFLATGQAAPPGWRRVGDLVERTLVTDAGTAEAINRLLGSDG